MNIDRQKTIVKAMLFSYKELVTALNTAIASLEHLEKMYANNDIDYEVLNTRCMDLGMPKPPYSCVSPVEMEFFEATEQKILTKKQLQQWMQIEKRHIDELTLEKAQIEEALKALTDVEKFIIVLKYFERSSWSQIERSFEVTFPTRPPIYFEALKKRRDEAVDKLYRVLQHYILQWKI